MTTVAWRSMTGAPRQRLLALLLVLLLWGTARLQRARAGAEPELEVVYAVPYDASGPTPAPPQYVFNGPVASMSALARFLRNERSLNGTRVVFPPGSYSYELCYALVESSVLSAWNTLPPVTFVVAGGGRAQLNFSDCSCTAATNCTLPFQAGFRSDALVTVDSFDRDAGTVTFEGFEFTGRGISSTGALFRVLQGRLVLRNCSFIDLEMTAAPLLDTPQPEARYPGFMLDTPLQLVRRGTRAVVLVEDCLFVNVSARGSALMQGEDASIVVDRSRFSRCAATEDSITVLLGTSCFGLLRVFASAGAGSSFDQLNRTFAFAPPVLNSSLYVSELVVRDSLLSDSDVPDATLCAEGWASVRIERGTRIERTRAWNTAVPFEINQKKKLVPGGGALHAFADVMVRIADSTFVENSARFGGAVVLSSLTSQVERLPIVIERSSFVGNEAVNGAGGALFLWGDSRDGDGGRGSYRSPELGAVLNCTFTGNKATPFTADFVPDDLHSRKFGTFVGLGGAFVKGGLTQLRVEDSLFQDHAAGNGGSFAIVMGQCDLLRCRFEGGRVTGRGGAGVDLDNTVLGVEDCDFHGNHADMVGGALTSNLLSPILHSRFVANTASLRGGAISSFEKDVFFVSGANDQAFIYVFNCSFLDCSASSGGAISFKSKAGVQLRIENSTFANCSASDAGGAVYGASVTEFYTTFALHQWQSQRSVYRSCRAARGGALFFDGRSGAALQLLDDVFENNEALKLQGGAVATNTLFSVSMVGVECRNNSAAVAENDEARDTRSRLGGCLWVMGTNTVRLEASLFAHNRADYGGAVFVRNALRSSVRGCHFSHNEAVSSPDTPSAGSGLDGGGALAAVTAGFTAQPVEPLLVADSLFEANCARVARGGAVAVYGCVLVLNGSDFVNNVALLDGGAVHAGGTGHEVRVGAGSRLVGNTAGRNGGGIASAGGGALAVSDATLDDNSAGAGGGALYALQAARVDIENVRATRNSVCDGGGGALLVVACGVARAVDCVFRDNVCNGTAPGGALAARDGTPLVLRGTCVFRGNLALHERGGAVFVDVGGSLDEAAGTVVFEGNVAAAGAAAWVPAPDALVGESRDGFAWEAVASAPAGLAWPASQSTRVVVSSGFVFNDLQLRILDGFGRVVRWLAEPMEVVVELRAPPAFASAELLGGEPGQLSSQGAVPLPPFRLLAPDPGAYELDAVLTSSAGEVSRAPPLQVDVVPCRVGQQLVDGGSCSTCDAASYSTVGGRACRSCEEHATCTKGVIRANLGYFVFAQPDGSARVIKCLPRMCTGGAAGNATCAPHHTGPLCGTCEDGFVLWRGRCTACESVNAGAVALLLLLIFVIVLYFVFVSKSSGGGWASVVFFAQATMLMYERTVYAAEDAELSSVVPSVMSLQLDYVSAACVAPLSTYEKFWLTLLAPAAFFFLFGLLYALEKYGLNGSCHKKFPSLPINAQRKRERYKNASLQLVLLLYLPISRRVLDMLNCRETFAGSGDERLVVDPSIQCSGGQYALHKAVAIVMAILWVYLAPLFLLLLLFVRRASRANLRILRPFRPHAWWMGAAMELRKTLLATVYVFSAELQTALLLFVFIFSSLFLGHLIIQPFESERENVVEAIFLCLLSFGASVLSSAWYQSTPDSDTTNTTLNVLFLSVLLVIGLVVAHRTVRAWRLRLAEKYAEGGMRAEQQEQAIAPLRHRLSALGSLPMSSSAADVELDELKMEAQPGEEEDDEDGGDGWTKFETDDGVPYWHKDGVSVWELPQ